MLLELRDVAVAQGKAKILAGVDLTIRAGEVVGLIGPNGAGKTTLLKAAMRLIPFQGYSNLTAMNPQQLARHAAYLPQSRQIAWPVSVDDLVALGRLPWPGGGRSPQDREAITGAIARMGLEPLRKRPALNLSGGEQARVLLARALAQQTPLLLADEPAAGLDPAHQLACLRLFRDLAAEGRGVLTSIHDLGTAARFCDRLVLVSGGGIMADGPPDRVLTDDLMRAAFGIGLYRGSSEHGPVIMPV